MSFTYSGFIKDDIDDIIARIGGQFVEAVPTINLDPSSIFYQWIKVVALEELYMQTMLEKAIANMTVLGSEGVFLDYHAIEAGLFRKEGNAAYGNVQVTRDVGLVPYTIQANSIFSTSNNIAYTVDTAVTFPLKIQMTRDTDTTDYLPEAYYSIEIKNLYDDSNLTSPISTGYYSYASGIVTWSNTGYLAYGSDYWIGLTGTLVMNVAVTSTSEGTLGNTAANTITVNYSSLDIDSVNNEDEFLNGQERETDTALRYRILQSSRKTFSLQKINDIITQHESVQDSRTYQDTIIDLCSISGENWDLASGYASGASLELIGTGTYGFSFFPSEGIGTLQGVTLYGKVKGNPSSLYCYLAQYTSGIEAGTGSALSDITVDRGILDSALETEFQDLYIPIKYNGFDRTKTYRLYLQPTEEADTDNCWVLGLVTGLTIDSYRTDHFSGNTSLVDSGYIYKTHYGSPSFTISVRTVDGVAFADIKEELEDMLDYTQYDCYAPVCIQSTVKEATEVLLSLSVIITKLAGYTFTDIKSRIIANIQTYLRSLHPGDDILYSQIEKIILNTEGVKKNRGLRIRLGSDSWVDNTTEMDLFVGDDEFIDLDLDNVTIAEG